MAELQQTGSVKYSLEKLRHPETLPEIIASLHYDVTSSEWILAPLHRSWYEQILWTYGEHYLEWNQRTRRFQIRPVRLYIPRSVTNLILPKVEIGVALFLDSLPRARYVPTTPDANDRDTAEAATGIMRYRDSVGRFSQKKRDLANWVVTTGTGFLQAIEDRANARRVQSPRMRTDPATGEETPEVDEQGQPIEDEIVMADEGVEVLTPFEVVPDWNARYPWEWRRYTHVRARTRDWIGSVFGSEARENVKAESATGTIGTMGYYQLKLLDIQMRASLTGSYGLPYGYGGAIADFRYMEDSAIVLSRYELPSEKRPDGRHLIVSGDKLLHDGPYPYFSLDPKTGQKEAKLNLFTFRWSVLPGSIFGFGMVRNLIPCQKRLNGIDTQVDLIRKTMGIPRILTEKRSQVSFDLSTSEPAHIYNYKHRAGVPQPTVLPATGADEDAHRQREFILRDMEQIAGVPDVLRGDQPTGVSAGIALETLTERAVKRFEPAIEDNREEFKRLYEMRIQIARDSNAWQEPREVPMLGDNGRIAMRHFQAADFGGNLMVDIEVVPISALSQVFKKQTAKDLVEMGVIDIAQEGNRDKLRALFGLAEFSEAVDADRRQAESEDEKMAEGMEVHRQPFDNDVVHLECHLKAIKGAKFETLAPESKQAAYAHLQEHYEAMRAADAATAPPLEPGAPAPGEETSPPGAGAPEPVPATEVVQ